MFGESGVSHTGKMYTYYKCAATKKKKIRDKKTVRKQRLEDLAEQQKERQARVAEGRQAKPEMDPLIVYIQKLFRYHFLQGRVIRTGRAVPEAGAAGALR